MKDQNEKKGSTLVTQDDVTIMSEMTKEAENEQENKERTQKKANKKRKK